MAQKEYQDKYPKHPCILKFMCVRVPCTLLCQVFDMNLDKIYKEIMTGAKTIHKQKKNKYTR